MVTANGLARLVVQGVPVTSEQEVAAALRHAACLVRDYGLQHPREVRQLLIDSTEVVAEWRRRRVLELDSADRDALDA